MNQNISDSERKELRRAIAHLEAQRSVLGDAVVDPAVESMREKLAALEEAGRSNQQRKLVTVIFMDTVGSTEITRSLDPEDNLEIMGTALRRLSVPVEELGGIVLETMGDGFMAVFGIPLARENDAEAAVKAGLGILAAAEAYAQDLKKKGEPFDYQVRVGINTGLVAVIEKDGIQRISGMAINLAARLESAAGAGTVVISQHTYQHIRGSFDLRPLEPIAAKGFPEPVPVYRVLQVKRRSFRTRGRGVEGVETRMVGRDRELNALQESYRALEDTSQCRFVTILGDAGLGKSRLLYEFEHWADLQSLEVYIYRGRARLETKHLPYGLLRDLFTLHLAIHDDDSIGSIQEKVISEFTNVLGNDADDEAKGHIVGRLLGYDFGGSPHLGRLDDNPRQLRDMAHTFLGQYFAAAAAKTPLLLLLEDLHWADDSSLDTLVYLARVLKGHPVLFVVSARSLLFERRPHWTDSLPFHMRLELFPLTDADSALLVRLILQKIIDLPESLRELIVDKSEGNPFYVEELIKMLVDDGVILKGEEVWWLRPEQLGEIQIPATLTGVLQARVDGLPEEERILLQQASVVGRVFWDVVLKNLNRSGEGNLPLEAINAGLLALMAKEMVYRRDLSAFSSATEHIFKHALQRDVAYESVSKKVRRKYHAVVADWLRSQSDRRANDIAGLIADHLEKAGDNERAMVYFSLAAEKAEKRYANSEAAAFYHRAISLSAGRDKVRLLPKLGRLLVILGQHSEAQRVFQEALKLSAEEDVLTKARLINGEANSLRSQHHFDEASTRYRDALDLLGQFPDNPDQKWVQVWIDLQLARADNVYLAGKIDELSQLGQELQGPIDQYGTPRQQCDYFSILTMLGNRISRVRPTAEVLHYAQTAYKRAQATGDQMLVSEKTFSVGFTLLWRGKLQKASEYLKRALDTAERTSNLPLQNRCLAYLAICYRLMGNIKLVKEFTQRGLASASMEGNHFYIGVARANMAWLSYYEGNTEKTITEGEKALNDWTGLSYPFNWLACWPLLAISLDENRLADAVAYAEMMIDETQQSLPKRLGFALEAAVEAGHNYDHDITVESLQEALAIAIKLSYL